MNITEHLRAGLRAGQQAMADWQGGILAVSAVPGAGKSTGMAVATAITIARFNLHRQHQLVLVTFTRSAASSLRAKVRRYLETWGLPLSAFTVNTIHSLALNIATAHPEISGIRIGETEVLGESQRQSLIKKAVQAWIRDYPTSYRELASVGNTKEETELLQRQMLLKSQILPELLRITLDTAKSANLTPKALQHSTAPILQLAGGLYETYNQLLAATGKIDYNDMILGAIRALAHPQVRQELQDRIFAVFEDEAQDSSPLQTQLLEILAGTDQVPNLIRVGDPNQAINSTFTTADPRFFNDFCDRCAQINRLVTLDQAGRSTQAIIDFANHFLAEINKLPIAPFRPQFIKPVPPNDPQPQANPPAIGAGVEIYPPSLIPDITAELQQISDRILKLYTQNPELSMAILVKEHTQGKIVSEFLHQKLKNSGIRFFDVEQRYRQSQVPRDLLTVLKFMHRPHSPEHLKNLLTLCRERIPEKLESSIDPGLIATYPERCLYPTPLDHCPAPSFSRLCTGLLSARLKLPLYHLIPFIAFTLNYEAGELATAGKLHDRLEQQLGSNFCLSQMIEALTEIIEEEKFEPVETELSEDIYTQKSQVTLLTYHKAKGLGWDVVFLPFMSNKLFPKPLYVPREQQFLANYTFADVARVQIRALVHNETLPNELEAWERAKLLKQAEDWRLLYVGITRAKRLLYISCARQQPFNWYNPNNLEDVFLCLGIQNLASRQGWQ
ncbi:MAG: ATP-dependent helicase [Pseudanabaenaceae cyanobacterium]